MHLTSHTGDTPIQCPWCPQKFAYNSACRTHKQRCHHEEMAQLASGQIQLPLPQQNSNNISSMINPSTVRNITVHDLGIQSLSVQEVPVETITLQNMNIMPQYEINLPPKIESAD